MPIRLRMTWFGQTADEWLEAIGIDEQYHGGPYPSKYLATEAFMTDGTEADCVCSSVGPVPDYDCEFHAGVPHKAEALEERLPEVIELAVERQWRVYREERDPEAPDVQIYRDFVEQARRKEDETGAPVRIRALQ